MAVVIVIPPSEQSADGKTLTYFDGSIVTEPDTIGAFTRQFVLTDSNGADLDTLVLGTGESSADYTVTKDMWINVKLQYIGATTIEDTAGHYYYRNTANKLIEANAEGCCTSKSAKENINEALRFIKGAEYAAPIGNAVAFQTNIDAANLYLDQVV